MHYRNGREAKNGDKIISFACASGIIAAYGVLHSAQPGSDYCNGNIATLQDPRAAACLCDCLHVEDVQALIAAAGLDQRPPGK